MKIVVKKKLKVTKGLMAALSLITIITLVTTVNACYSNRIFLIARGEDMDLPRSKDLIIGKIELDEFDEPTMAQVIFHQKLYDESGEMYVMKGMLKDGLVFMTDHCFYCPITGVFFVNVWWFQGVGMFKTTDTDFNVFFRNSLPITMPNTEGQYVPASIFMWLSLTAEYRDASFDPNHPENPPIPTGPVKAWPEGRWALAGVFWNVSIPMDFGFGLGILPIGPVSYLTRSIGI